MTITTYNVNGRSDWFHAVTTVDTRVYESFQTTRHAAFMEIVRQLTAKHLIKW